MKTLLAFAALLIVLFVLGHALLAELIVNMFPILENISRLASIK